jgi:DNA repair protein RadC
MKSGDYSMDELLQLVREKADTYSAERINSASDIFSLLYEYSLKEKEYFLLVTLDGASAVIAQRVIHIGTLNQSLVHPREVFRPAILDNAAGVIIAHNHPSGTLEPSRADIQITQRLKEVAKLVGIELLDHVILTVHGYRSLSDEGVL